MNIDLSYLEDITGGDKEMMIEMLDLFIEDIPEQISLIKTHANEKNLSKLGSETHKLKPTLQYVGLFEMFEIIKELEESAKSGVYSEEINSLANKVSEYSKEAIPLLHNKRKELS